MSKKIRLSERQIRLLETQPIWPFGNMDKPMPKPTQYQYDLSNSRFVTYKNNGKYFLGQTAMNADNKEVVYAHKPQAFDSPDEVCMFYKHLVKSKGSDYKLYDENTQMTEADGNIFNILGDPCEYANKMSESKMKKIKMTEGQLAKVVQYIKESDITHNLKQDFKNQATVAGLKEKPQFVENTEGGDKTQELASFLGANYSHLQQWVRQYGGEKFLQNYQLNGHPAHFFKALILGMATPIDSYDEVTKKYIPVPFTPEVIDNNTESDTQGVKFSQLPIFVQNVWPRIQELKGGSKIEPENSSREMGVDPTTEGKITGGHPVMGDGTDYKPQTPAENEKTGKSFQESINMNEDGIVYSLLEFAQEIIQFLKDILSDGSSKGLSTVFQKLGMSRGELFSLMADFGLITYAGAKIYVNAKNFKRNIKRLYSYIKGQGGKKEVAEEDNNIEPTTTTTSAIVPNQIDAAYKVIYMNKEIVIMKNKMGEFFVFYYGNIDNNKLLQYIESNDIDANVINGYVNDNLDTLSKGEGIEAFKNGDDLVKVDSNVASELVRTYQSDKLAQVLGLNQNENTVAGAASMGGSSGPFVGKLEGTDVIKRDIYEANKMHKKDGSAVQRKRVSLNYKHSTSKLRKCSICEHYSKEHCSIIWGKVNPRFVCDAFETKDVEENTTTGSVGGSYVTPMVWAKDKSNWKNGKKTMYPGGKIVEALRKLAEDNQTSTAYPDGGFVEFDDCTKLNNNTDAENGGCSVGAVDNVVKVKQTKSSVISKEGKYNTGD